MSSRGWIKLHRKLLDNPIFQDPYLLKLWMYCLLKATHSKHKQLVGNEVVELEEGQFIWGRIEATQELNKGSKHSEKKSESTWERNLKLLEKLELLNRKTNNKYTVVTIDKWGVYQHKDNGNKHEDEQQVNSKRTADEQQVNTNKNVKNLRIKEPISTTAENDAIVFYQNNIGMIRPNIAEEMLDYIKDFSDEIVIESLKRSLDRNKPSWGYARSILNSWQSKNIKTMEQIQSEDVEFQNQQKQRFNNHKPRPQEKLPDWYEKHQQEVARFEEKKDREREQGSNQNEDEIEKELDDLINSVKRGG